MAAKSLVLMTMILATPVIAEETALTPKETPLVAAKGVATAVSEEAIANARDAAHAGNGDAASGTDREPPHDPAPDMAQEPPAELPIVRTVGEDVASKVAGAPVDKGKLDRFCADFTDAARENRYRLKEQELKNLLSEVLDRMKALEDKRAELEGWVKRREEFAKRATGNLVEIYAKMKPEAAAARIAIVEPELAASIMLSLTPRQASIILNEMEETKAAAITDYMAASARPKDPS